MSYLQTYVKVSQKSISHFIFITTGHHVIGINSQKKPGYKNKSSNTRAIVIIVKILKLLLSDKNIYRRST